ncbi:soma ferritin-like [Artemia franciscana]|uniref:soma ferritin-like n=1 Tax=Artemia franciscana TaxID=6661 RepID=UPI0032DA2C42
MNMSVSKCRQNFHVEVEAAINKQINLELHASYIYLSMATHFGRDDVALPGLEKFYLESSHEERDHAEMFIKYQLSRGGRVVFANIERPTKEEWSTALEAMEYALNLEKEVNDSLLKLHQLGSNHSDPHLTDFLEGKFLDEQVESINKLSHFTTKLKRVGDGLGVYEFDKELQ